MLLFFVVFFFKQKTAYEMRISDWSSDVCSSDLIYAREIRLRMRDRKAVPARGHRHRDRVLIPTRERPRSDGLKARSIPGIGRMDRLTTQTQQGNIGAVSDDARRHALFLGSADMADRNAPIASVASRA